jgi:hypothetical protein
MAKTKKAILSENPQEKQKGWSTLHIFGYGETQVNGSVGRKVATTSLTKVQAVIDYVYSLKPADNNAGTEYHAITIAKNVFARFTPKAKEEKSFTISFKDLDTTTIEELVAELEAIEEVVAEA